MIFVRIFGRLIMIALGYALAALAAGHVLFAIGVVEDPAAIEDYAKLPFDVVLFGFFAAFFVGITAFLPAVVAIVTAELFRIQSWIYHVTMGGVLAIVVVSIVFLHERDAALADLSSPLVVALLASGFIGGFVYWLVAGRNSGAFYGDAPAAADDLIGAGDKQA